MTETKWTPTPWIIVDREVLEDGSIYPAHIIGGSRSLEICRLESDECAELAVADPNGPYASDSMVEADGDVRSAKANARLIAAAPTLDEAAGRAIEIIRRNLYHQREKVEDAITVLEAARAKARGEQA